MMKPQEVTQDKNIMTQMTREDNKYIRETIKKHNFFKTSLRQIGHSKNI